MTGTREEKILVFAGKQVGLALVRFLIDSEAPLALVVVASATDRELIALLQEHGVPHQIFQRSFNDPGRHPLPGCDWLLNLWSPHILSDDLLQGARQRLNIHPGLVPVCRGNDNAAWALRLGLPAGVSLLEMNARVDEGEVYAAEEIAWSFPLRGRDLHMRLEKTAIGLFRRCWPAIFRGELRPQPQTGPVNYFTRKKTETDRKLDAREQMSLGEFTDWLLAHDFAPGTTAEMERDGRRFALCLQIEELPKEGGQ